MKRNALCEASSPEMVKILRCKYGFTIAQRVIRNCPSLWTELVNSRAQRFPSSPQLHACIFHFVYMCTQKFAYISLYTYKESLYMFRERIYTQREKEMELQRRNIFATANLRKDDPQNYNCRAISNQQPSNQNQYISLKSLCFSMNFQANDRKTLENQRKSILFQQIY